MAINAALTRRFQRNLLRKMAADAAEPVITPPDEDPSMARMYFLNRLAQGDPTAWAFADAYGDEGTDTQRYFDATGTIQQVKNDKAAYQNDNKSRIAQVLKAYAPYVGGGAALGALLGGGIGYGTAKNKTQGTLLGSLIGAGGGAAVGGLGKYLYDKSSE